jgi:cell division protein FtsB
MPNFQAKKHKNNNWQKALILRGAIFIVLVLIFLLSRAVFSLYNKSTLASDNKEISADNLSELEVQKQDLEDRIERLSSERGQEEVIRKNFSMSKDGEKVFIVVDQEETEKGTTTKPIKQSGWNKFLEGFKNIFSF